MPAADERRSEQIARGIRSMVKWERRENIHSHIHEIFVVRGRGRVLHAVPNEVLGLLCETPKA